MNLFSSNCVFPSQTNCQNKYDTLGLSCLNTFFFYNFFHKTRSSHRGLKLDGAIGQGEICNSLKSENFSKSFLSHIGKNKKKFRKKKFLAIIKH